MKTLGKRALLNLPGHYSTAAVVAEIEDTRQGCAGEEPVYCLAISDCDRTIQFELEWDTPAGRATSLHKVRTLATALQAFSIILEAEQQRHEERSARS